MDGNDLYHKASWQDGQVITDPNAVICKCCGRRMGFRFTTLYDINHERYNFYRNA